MTLHDCSADVLASVCAYIRTVFHNSYVKKVILPRQKTAEEQKRVNRMSAGSTITKTIWQYSETLPEDTIVFLKEIASDYGKVKNYTYKRYSGIRSLGRLTPAFDIMSEVRHSGIRTQLGLPSAYFDPAIIEAVADIKGM